LSYKSGEQNRPPRVVDVAQPIITKDITIPATEYNEFLQFKAARQPSSAVVAQSSKPVAFISTSSLGPWILDSSASDNMIGNKPLLSHLSFSDSLPYVSVTDDSKIKVQGLGQAHPLPNLSLDFVLHILGCSFNLIYVNKLTRTHDCLILFTDNFFNYVQDRHI
jgi:hypothetical protein